MRSVTAFPGVVASVSTLNSSREPGSVATKLRGRMPGVKPRLIRGQS